MWLGFGALLPVLPLYFTEQGVDLALLGIVIAAWPAARLIGEPIFGWLADRTARVPLMVVGLLATGLFCILPLAFTGPLAFIVLRAVRRAVDRDLRPGRPRLPDRRDAAGASRRGVRAVRRRPDGRAAARAGDRGASAPNGSAGSRSCSSSAAIAAWLAAIPIGLRGRETGVRTHPAPSPDATEFPPEAPSTTGRAAADVTADRDPDPALRADRAASRLWNRGLIAVLVINAGGYFAGGTYEVIWSLFLDRARGEPRPRSG